MLCFTACKTISLFFLNVGDINENELDKKFELFVIEIKTISLSSLKLLSANLKANPLCLTACKTISLSALKLMEANCKEQPFCLTACKTISLSFLNSVDK